VEKRGPGYGGEPEGGIGNAEGGLGAGLWLVAARSYTSERSGPRWNAETD